ncbi:MAG: carboxypeptidase regulatory-like domain-containing protein [Sedimentisphaerales bacterium]
MKKRTAFIIVFLLSLSAYALDYNDFPPNLQQILEKNIRKMNSKEDFFIAGRVSFSDDAQITSGKDLKANLSVPGGIDEPIWVYDYGWLIMDRPCKFSKGDRPWKFIIRAFGYDPIDASIAVSKGKVTYVDYVLNKTPAEKLSSITGIVVNENNQPIEGAVVTLTFPGSNYGSNEVPEMTMDTGPDGRYSFKGLSSTEHYILFTSPGYAYHTILVKPPTGQIVTNNIILSKNLKIVIDYVYQDSNSLSFTDGNLQSGTVEWANGNEGMDFSDGKAKKGYDPQSRDLEMRQNQNSLIFNIFYVNGKNGFADLGVVNFDSITKVPKNNYDLKSKACEIGHVYVVRTQEGRYAKFIVKDILPE